ncbi:hypothetical protein CCM_04639 [Cordyceps militaris CM01]|uniref:Uncharacterized protein n=1 Tax=Cordyceps militaris (strain CM01) TaxID=983644 RepID=G3JGD6_CORMM|nr:uncharacterized protein CCM_04639 [Cordyceps militaris CM01]EGX93266.1 hypothetical protein CCM_04639 [Cordyceps militaris CM01]
MLDILHPLIKAKDLDKLLKVFALRRPRVALWWLAIFLLGDMSVLDWIRRYATTLNEKYGFGSQSPPDPIVFPWTGAIQSFLDFASRPHLSEAEQISNEDILRMRFNLKLQDSASVPVAWRPFGCRDKRQVEIELWPYLETGLIRRYLCFTWYSPKTGHRVHEEGFRRDTGRQIIWTTDDLKWVSTDSTDDDCLHSIKRAPSKDSTLRMMSMLVEDAMGGRHWSNSGFPGVLKDYAWLHDWEGLATMDVPENPAKAAIEASKPPSWFLQQWMIGAYDG